MTAPHRKLLLALMALTASFYARAEHLVGGMLTYECVGDATYVVTLTVYRDCNSSGADFDQFATIGIFNENNLLVTTKLAPYPEVDQLEVITGNPCLSAPPNICVERGITTVQITVPDPSQSYTLVYQRCCRNATIQNLTNPGAQGNTMTATIPPTADGQCNSSPSFDNYPPLVLCDNEPLNFDHSATDPDGDSLSYSLCAPFNGGSQAVPAPNPPSNPPYDQVVWGTDFSATNPLGANPSMSIDPVTGMLEVIPNQVGQFVVGVCVTEWRGGQQLSSNRRDFQFNITQCLQQVDAQIDSQEPEDICNGLDMDFNASTESVSLYHWDFGDPTTQADTANFASPTYTYPDTGVYTVTLIGNPGYECADTSTVDFQIYEDVDPFFSTPELDCEGGEHFYNFNAGGQYIPDLAQYEWVFGGDAQPSGSFEQNPDEVTFPGPGEYPVTLTISQTNCSESIESVVTVPEPIEIDITPQESFCNGLNVPFSQSNNGATHFHWDFGVPGTEADTSNVANLNYTFPEPGEYTVTLEAYSDQNCPATATSLFEVYPLLEADFERPPVECFDENSVDFDAGGNFTSSAQFEWEFEGGSPSTSNAQNPESISFESLGVFDVHLTISENGCVSETQDSVRVEPNPIALFDAHQYEGCVPLQVGFINNSITTASSHGYTWQFGDGENGGGENTGHTYERPGTYTVTLELNNFSGCEGSSKAVITDLITAYPRPKAGFDVSSTPVSIFEPIVDIDYKGSGASSCSYYIPGEKRIDKFTISDYRFAQLTPQTIRQVVESDHGCRASTEKYIPFNDHVVYTPNAFTPNGDGVNDIFRPKARGAEHYQMRIYDRWGQMIFYGEDGTGWNGSVKSGNHYAPAGTYTWLITIQDLRGWNHDYKGSVNLLR